MNNNSGAFPTVRASDIYGGADNSVMPAPGPSTAEMQTGGDNSGTKLAQIWLAGAIVALVVLRFLYEKAG